MALLSKPDPEKIRAESARLDTLPLAEVLRWSWEKYGVRAAIGTSFQGAGLVILDHAVKHGIPLPVFTMDTGLLFPETLELKKRLEGFFGIEIETISPEQSVEQQAKVSGPNLWSHRPDTCCALRKVIPLQNQLRKLDVWITGVRREQAKTREQTRILELYHFDVIRDQWILKLNPVCHWSKEAIWKHIRSNEIPYSPLTDQGYRSIGCQPCTRPVSSDEADERAGRWTGFDKAECGIHTFLGSNI